MTIAPVIIQRQKVLQTGMIVPHQVLFDKILGILQSVKIMFTEFWGIVVVVNINLQTFSNFFRQSLMLPVPEKGAFRKKALKTASFYYFHILHRSHKLFLSWN
jgi:hypothetical protein